MKRLAILCEGHTEREFVRTTLAPHLESKGITTAATMITTSPGHKGGHGRDFDKIKKDLARLLLSFDAVSTMLDFYGLPANTPGYTRQWPTKPLDRADAAENMLRSAMKAPSKLIPGIMVHEFETLMFVDVVVTAQKILTDSGPERLASKAAELTTIVSAAGEPEAIDNGQHTAPSKRLAKVFDDPSYDKVLHGPAIANSVGLPALRAACPVFDRWITRLEAVA